MKILSFREKSKKEIPSIKEVVAFLVVIFIVAFPKGGIKIAQLPLTWGYLFLFLALLFTFFTRSASFSKYHLLLYLGFTPFIFVSSVTLLINRIDDLGYAASYFFHFYLIAFFFFIQAPQRVDPELEKRILKWIKSAIMFAAVYGIFLFFFRLFSGYFFLIPGLTVNIADVELMEETKCIDRGGVFKLISTYNNGNLYGICQLMFLPLFSLIEKKGWKDFIVKTSLVLTLSRTIWLGLFAYEILNFLFFQKGLTKKITFFIAYSAFFIIMFYGVNAIFPLSLDFVFDRFLGNRIGQFRVLDAMSWFSYHPFVGIYEIIYLGILSSFGLVGLITFFWAFLSPFFLICFQNSCITPLQKRAFSGLCIYLLVACSDGALLLIPVLTFCFFLLFLCILRPAGTSFDDNKSFEAAATKNSQ